MKSWTGLTVNLEISTEATVLLRPGLGPDPPARDGPSRWPPGPAAAGPRGTARSGPSSPSIKVLGVGVLKSSQWVGIFPTGLESF